MSDPYRHMSDVLGESERDSAAIQDLGRWRSRISTIVILGFALAGLVPAGLGYWFAMEMQFRYNDGVAFLIVNVAGATIPWLAMFLIGSRVGRMLVRRRTPAKLASLAKAYEVSVEELARTATLVDDL